MMPFYNKHDSQMPFFPLMTIKASLVKENIFIKDIVLETLTRK